MCTTLWMRRCVRGKKRFLMMLFSLLTVCVALQTLTTRVHKNRLLLEEETYPVVSNFWFLDARPSPHQVSPRVRPPPSCSPRTHLVFLKTHKTGSSTILNVLYRYGEQHHLRFAFPYSRFNQLFYPRSFRRGMVHGATNKSLPRPDILCNHMRFNKSEVEKVMPSDSFYFSILRHPATMLESIFSYYKSFSIFKTSKNLADFFNDSLSNYTAAAMHNNYAHNNLAFDFGFNNTPTAHSDDLEAAVASAIKSIERDFHLILINEYFDESMVLLRHALCWPLEDVVSFKLNSRTNKSRRSISPETVEQVKLWNALDWRLYQHFNASFWRKVDTLLGREEMSRQVSQLRQLQAKQAQECLKDGRPVNPSQIKDRELKPLQYGQAVIEGYVLNPELSNSSHAHCLRLIMPELQYTYFLYDRQIPRKPTKELLPKDRKSLKEDRKSLKEDRKSLKEDRKSLKEDRKSLKEDRKPEK